MVEFTNDATLLERFVSGREEAAFGALVRRHGPRVERICRRILRNEHDVEDVFQATFAVLARKAAGFPWRESVGPWLDNVARRLSLHARSGAARQKGREITLTALVGGPIDSAVRLPERYHPRIEPSPEVERRELRRVLDDELLQLPEKYRAPIVLCDLEGRTREEAARQLGWPTGSMSRRLDRGRLLLRRRLTHRGVALVVFGLATLAVVAASVGWPTRRHESDSSVRQVMAAFRPEAEGGRGYGSILAAARDSDRRPDVARLLPAAREAATAARQLEGHDVPGPLAVIWRQFAREMGSSARDLERACRDSDALAAVAAARRLDASCLHCHAAFRDGTEPGVSRSSEPIPIGPFTPEVSTAPTLGRAATHDQRDDPPRMEAGSIGLASLAAESPRIHGTKPRSLPAIPRFVANQRGASSVKTDESLDSDADPDLGVRPIHLAGGRPPVPRAAGRWNARILAGPAHTLI
jgi:RNA polymerase sigma-70 factor (ECF subfamily)